MRGFVLLNGFGLLVGKVKQNIRELVFNVLCVVSLEHPVLTEEGQQKTKTDLKTRKRIGKSVVIFDFFLAELGSPLGAVTLVFYLERGKEFFFALAVGKIYLPQPFGICEHTSHQHTAVGLLLDHRERWQVKLSGLHLHTEQTRRSTLTNVGGKLCRYDCVPLRRSCFTELNVSGQTVASCLVTVTSCQGLHRGFHSIAFFSACRVVIVNASQHVLEREGRVNNAVGGIPKAHRQIGVGEVAEEG